MKTRLWSSSFLSLVLLTSPARADQVSHQARPLLTLHADESQPVRAGQVPPDTDATDAWLVFTDELPFRGTLALRAYDDTAGESPGPPTKALLPIPGGRWWQHVTWKIGENESPVQVNFTEDADATPDASPLAVDSVRSASFVAHGLTPGDHRLVATLEWPAGEPLAGLRVSSEPIVLVVRDTSDEQSAWVRRDEEAVRALETGDFAAFERLMLAGLARTPSVGRWTQLAEASVGRATMATTAAYYREATVMLEAEIAKSCGTTPQTRGCAQRRQMLLQLSSFGQLRPFLESTPDLQFRVLKLHGTQRHALIGRGLSLRFDTVDEALLEQVRQATRSQ